MRRPIFRFQEERLTDAPVEAFRVRLTGPGTQASLKACPGLRPVEQEGEGLVLRWHHTGLGAVEDGTLRVTPHEQGAHLLLNGRLRGWSAFLLLGWMRWRADRLLDRLVREL
jgi:hypothetical protein